MYYPVTLLTSQIPSIVKERIKPSAQFHRAYPLERRRWFVFIYMDKRRKAKVAFVCVLIGSEQHNCNSLLVNFSKPFMR